MDMRRKMERGLRPLFGEGARSLSNTLSPEVQVYLHTKFHLDASSRLAAIEMGRELETGAPPPFGGVGGSPFYIKSPGLRPTSMPITTLIHLAV